VSTDSKDDTKFVWFTVRGHDPHKWLSQYSKPVLIDVHNHLNKSYSLRPSAKREDVMDAINSLLCRDCDPGKIYDTCHAVVAQRKQASDQKRERKRKMKEAEEDDESSKRSKSKS